MESIQLKDTGDILFFLFCVISVIGSYIVAIFKTSLQNDRLKESMDTLTKALSIMDTHYQTLAKQKTIVVIQDKTTGVMEIRALNTTPEEYARSQDNDGRETNNAAQGDQSTLHRMQRWQQERGSAVPDEGVHPVSVQGRQESVQ